MPTPVFFSLGLALALVGLVILAVMTSATAVKLDHMITTVVERCK
jgi:hypothetical protein